LLQLGIIFICIHSFVLGFICDYLMILACFSQLPQSRERYA